MRNPELYPPEAISELVRQRIASQMTSWQRAESHAAAVMTAMFLQESCMNVRYAQRGCALQSLWMAYFGAHVDGH